MLCAKQAIKRLSTKHGGKGGAIVTVGSIAATTGGIPGMVAYATSKGAIASLTIGLAKEVAREDVAGYLEADRAFHWELLKQAGNPRVTQIAMEQRDAMRLYGIDSAAGRDRQVASVEEHHQLVNLASAGKAHPAGQLMSRHILEWQPIFAATLDRRIESDPVSTRPLPTRRPLQHGLARSLRRQS